MEHTQGTWRVTGTGTIRYIDVSVGNGMVQEVATCMRTEYGDMEANARRIVACVNACAGLDTEKLEHQNVEGVPLWMFVQDLSRQKEYLMQQLKEERVVWSAKRTELLRNHDAELARRKATEAQRDELLAVLEAMLEEVSGCYCTTEAEARAVIQKVRGGE